MESQEYHDNQVRLDVILRASDSCDLIESKINHLDELCSLVSDTDLSRLTRSIDDVCTYLQDDTLRDRSNYKNLSEHAPDVEHYIYSINKLSCFVDDSNKFKDAIEILRSCTKIYEEHGRQVPIIEQIYRQSEKLRSNLIVNLCNQLERMRDASDSEIRDVMNLLIDCDTFSDRDLKLRYLQARDNWFNDECDAKNESFDDLINFFCQALPRIFKEFKNVFDDSIRVKDYGTNVIYDDLTKEHSAIINSWLLLKTSTFIISLEYHLNSMSQTEYFRPSTLSDTIKKCFRLTNWLASIGFDFSSQLRPLFSKVIANEVRLSVEKATIDFETRFTQIVSQSIESLLLPIDDEILRISNMKPEDKLPESIEHYPIFKIYCLHLIDSLRWIQTTCDTLSPINTCLKTYAALNASLTRIMQALAVVLNNDYNSSHPILSRVAISFLTEVLPFFSDFCERVFPERVILGVLGMSKMEFKNLCTNDPEQVKDFRLDFRKIGDPLRSTMPALMQTIVS